MRDHKNDTVLRTDIAIGVDGCSGGWIAAIWKPGESNLTMKVVRHLAQVIDAYPRVAIGVDVPIGLSSREPRACDVAARKLLSPKRTSSVFPAPCRGILRLDASHAVTTAKSKEQTGRGISLQTYHLMPKIVEVDDVMSPDLQQRILEVHPEVSFWALANEAPMAHPKKKLAGFKERRELLRGVFPHDAIPETPRVAKDLVSEARKLGRGAAADDVLDAIVAAWTALRCATGEAERIPVYRERDECELVMEINY